MGKPVRFPVKHLKKTLKEIYIRIGTRKSLNLWRERKRNLLFDNRRLLDDSVAGTAVALEAEHRIRSHHAVVFAAMFIRADQETAIATTWIPP